MIYQGISAHGRLHDMWSWFIIIPVWTHEHILKSALPETGMNRFVVWTVLKSYPCQVLGGVIQKDWLVSNFVLLGVLSVG